MRGALLLATVPIGLALQEGGSEPEPVLAERAAVAGLRGFSSISRLVYHGAPDTPHRLVAFYVFPDRAVWRIGLEEDRPGQLTVSYRSGDACWEIGPGRSASVRFAGAERDAMVRRMELRRALTLWPDGFAWTGDGPLRRCELGPYGSLDLRLGPDGRPRRMTSFDRDGEEVESLTEIGWREVRGRWFPASLELALDGTPIWSEEISSVQTSLQFLDCSFRPPDRRPVLEPKLGHLGTAEHIDLRAASLLRTELPEGTDWAAAFERAIALRGGAAARARELERELEPRANFEVEGRRPVAIAFVFEGPALEPPPGGVSQRAEAPAVTVYARGGTSLDAIARALRREVPAGARPGRARVRIDPDRGFEGSFQVILPLLP